ncbi:MAG: hypothetical protein IJF07_06690 [Lachnospiraceae bacterium]|nr:hypothetical protein [Lachnospiraceae bacterium]
MQNTYDSKCLTKTYVIEQLKSIITDYAVFCEIATALEWFPIEEKHCAGFSYPLGLNLDVYQFEEGYVTEHFRECYIRSVLAGMIQAEEWEADTFAISAQERRECFTAGRTLYESYLHYKDLRLEVISTEYLRRQISNYAEDIDISCQRNQNTVYHASGNAIDRQELKSFWKYMEDAIVIEIGGTYADCTYLAVKPDSLLVVECGIWD